MTDYGVVDDNDAAHARAVQRERDAERVIQNDVGHRHDVFNERSRTTIAIALTSRPQ
jgi:hypothetical protein